MSDSSRRVLSVFTSSRHNVEESDVSISGNLKSITECSEHADDDSVISSNNHFSDVVKLMMTMLKILSRWKKKMKCRQSSVVNKENIRGDKHLTTFYEVVEVMISIEKAVGGFKKALTRANVNKDDYYNRHQRHDTNRTSDAFKCESSYQELQQCQNRSTTQSNKGEWPERALEGKDMAVIAQNIGENWQLIGYTLKISEAFLDHLKEDIDTVPVRIAKMLSKWKQLSPGRATLRNLQLCLKELPAVRVQWEILDAKYVHGTQTITRRSSGVCDTQPDEIEIEAASSDEENIDEITDVITLQTKLKQERKKRKKLQQYCKEIKRKKCMCTHCGYSSLCPHCEM